jgi:hypothetical protein
VSLFRKRNPPKINPSSISEVKDKRLTFARSTAARDEKVGEWITFDPMSLSDFTAEHALKTRTDITEGVENAIGPCPCAAAVGGEVSGGRRSRGDDIPGVAAFGMCWWEGEKRLYCEVRKLFEGLRTHDDRESEGTGLWILSLHRPCKDTRDIPSRQDQWSYDNEIHELTHPTRITARPKRLKAIAQPLSNVESSSAS